MLLEQHIKSEMSQAREIGSIPDLGQRKPFIDKPQRPVESDFKIIKQFVIPFEGGHEEWRVKTELKDGL